MPGTLTPDSPLDLVAHVIQVALTPIFLLSGIATLLNVFATRLARVADLVVQITKAMEEGKEAMRSFGQLMQLFEKKKQKNEDEGEPPPS